MVRLKKNLNLKIGAFLTTLVLLILALIPIIGLRVESIDNSLQLWKIATFQGCGQNLPDYKYTLEIPWSWNSKQVKFGGIGDSRNTYYEIVNGEQKFLIGCITTGAGGGCNYDTTKFEVEGKITEGCYIDKNTSTDKNYHLDDLFSSVNKSNAIFSFSSDGVNLPTLKKIIASFKNLQE